MNSMKKRNAALLPGLSVVLTFVPLLLVAQQPPAATPPPAVTPPAAASPSAAPPSVPITSGDLRTGTSSPDPKARANGDPSGDLTGNVSDITVADPVTDKTPNAKGLTLGDVVNQIGQNKIAINFVWTLITGFLVMFMQAGFAIVETGLCRAKNANHTMMMNFMVYGVGMLAFWLIGFTIQMGGVGAVGNLGGTPPLNHEVV